MTSGAASYGVPASATTTPPSRAASARSKRSGSSVCRVSSGWPSVTGVAGLGVQLDAGAGLHRVLLAGPAGAEPPGGEPDRHRVEPGEHAATTAPCTTCVSRAVGSAASGSPPWAAIIRRQASIAEPSAQPVGRVDVVATPAAASISRASASGQLDDVGRAAAGQHLDRLRDLERVAGGQPERGGHVGEQRDGASRRRRCPARPSSRPARGRWSRSFMNAPVPTLTSSTSAPVPSAIFLLMIEDAISGIASTVPVTSRSA